MLLCAAEFKRSWLNDPGRANVAELSARLVTQNPSAIKQTAIEGPGGIPFENTELPIQAHLPFGYYAVLGECCRPAAHDGIPPMGGVTSRRVLTGDFSTDLFEKDVDPRMAGSSC